MCDRDTRNYCHSCIPWYEREADGQADVLPDATDSEEPADKACSECDLGCVERGCRNGLGFDEQLLCSVTIPARMGA